MSTHITKYLAWLAMALTLSSCSCCRVEPPAFTPEDEKFFSKYKIGDTIKLASDTLKLDIVLKNISYNTGKYKGGGGTNKRICVAFNRKTFSFDLINYDKATYKKVEAFNLYYERGYNPSGEKLPRPEKYSDFLSSDNDYRNYDTITVNGNQYKNKIVFSLGSKFEYKDLEFIMLDSNGFIIATNWNNSKIYK